MASIERTYTSDYNEYKAFKDWADSKEVKFFNGWTENIGNYVRHIDKEEFDGREIPIMNPPGWMDCYLISSCPFEFVRRRLEYVYNSEVIEKWGQEGFVTSLPQDYQKGRDIIIEPYDKGCYSLTNKPFRRKGFNSWRLFGTGSWWYHEPSKVWMDIKAVNYPYTTNCSEHTSVKSLVRFLRNQWLPNDVEFTLAGNYVGERYRVICK